MRVLLFVLLCSLCAVGQAFDPSPLRDLNGDIEAARPVRPLCTAGLDKSPLVRGKFRLGMSRAAFDVASVTAGGVSIGAPTFFEDKLIAFSVNYDESVKWDADAEFAYVIADEFKLPPQAWRSNGQLGLVMFCSGWLMLAESNRLELRDEIGLKAKSTAESAAAKREAEAKKKTFKP